MSALSESLEAHQKGAVKAIAKAVIAAHMGDDEAKERLAAMGLTDDVDTDRFLAALGILRELGASEPVASRAAATEERPASDAQWNRIRRDCKAAGVEVPQGPLTMRQASETIEQLAAGTYEPVPF